MAERRGRGRPKETDTDTSATISRAALQRFAAQGFEATSLREIAADAGVDVALISYRFGGKLGLWKAIVSQSGLDLRDVLERAVEGMDEDDAQARLDRSARAFLAHLLERPEVPKLLLRDITVNGDRSQWLLETLSMPLHRRFVRLAQAAAEKRPTPPAHLEFKVASFIYAAASSVARRDRLGKLIDGIDSDAEFAAALEATLIEGPLAP